MVVAVGGNISDARNHRALEEIKLESEFLARRTILELVLYQGINLATNSRKDYYYYLGTTTTTSISNFQG